MDAELSDVQRSGSELLQRLRANPRNFGRQTELLSAFMKGFSITELIPLFQNPDEDVVLYALFIVEQLKCRNKEVLEVVAAMTTQQSSRVRGAALVSLAGSIGSGTEGLFECLLRAVEDPDVYCRRIAILFLMRLRSSLIHDAANVLSSSNDASTRKLMQQLLLADSADISQIKEWLSDRSIDIQRLGLIAAARTGVLTNSLLDQFRSSLDPELRDVGDRQLKFQDIRRR